MSIQAKTRRKPGPPPRPPEFRKTRKVGLTEATFAKVQALHGRFAEARGIPASALNGSDVVALAVDLAYRATGFEAKDAPARLEGYERAAADRVGVTHADWLAVKRMQWTVSLARVPKFGGVITPPDAKDAGEGGA